MYPDWANGIGFGMVGVALVFIPLLALVEYCKAHGIIEVMAKSFVYTYIGHVYSGYCLIHIFVILHHIHVIVISKYMCEQYQMEGTVVTA